jgi:hypothetical protein
MIPCERSNRCPWIRRGTIGGVLSSYRSNELDAKSIEGSELPLPAPSEAYVQSGIVGTEYADTFVPAAGVAAYYLVRGVNVCGEGTYGEDSSYAERSTDTCP